MKKKSMIIFLSIFYLFLLCLLLFIPAVRIWLFATSDVKVGKTYGMYPNTKSQGVYIKLLDDNNYLVEVNNAHGKQSDYDNNDPASEPTIIYLSGHYDKNGKKIIFDGAKSGIEVNFRDIRHVKDKNAYKIYTYDKNRANWWEESRLTIKHINGKAVIDYPKMKNSSDPGDINMIKSSVNLPNSIDEINNLYTISPKPSNGNDWSAMGSSWNDD